MSDERADGFNEPTTVFGRPYGDTAAGLVANVMAEAIILLRKQATWSPADPPAIDQAARFGDEPHEVDNVAPRKASRHARLAWLAKRQDPPRRP
ncbi:hypothetical protein ACIQ7Q_15785 [Streptomyces sp. NPDC096176]|uniref:hypothetical protein n=1 Tax=Streptomyces sp. NPDC096176 TaxID=3366079 RepID=UPI00381D4090